MDREDMEHLNDLYNRSKRNWTIGEPKGRKNPEIKRQPRRCVITTERSSCGG